MYYPPEQGLISGKLNITIKFSVLSTRTRIDRHHEIPALRSIIHANKDRKGVRARTIIYGA